MGPLAVPRTDRTTNRGWWGSSPECVDDRLTVYGHPAALLCTKPLIAGVPQAVKSTSLVPVEVEVVTHVEDAVVTLVSTAAYVLAR
jgi:hypothetical protein